jgi:putative nucleotidyltransferase with HDIG domain
MNDRRLPIAARIRQDIEALGDLPSLSPIVAQLIATLGREDVGVHEVETIIRRDPVIAARIVSAANAAAYAGHTPTTSIHGALMRLGFIRVRRLAVLVSLYNAMAPGRRLQQAYWRHSLAVAHAADFLGDRAAPEVNPDVVFLAGLLHDIGRLVLVSHFPGELDVVRADAGQYATLDEAERAILGIDHAEIGARLAGHWAFPESIVSAIWFHHRPALAAAEHAEPVAVVSLAEAICAGDPAIELQEGHGVDIADALGRLGVPPEARTSLIDGARAAAVRAAESLDMLG